MKILLIGLVVLIPFSSLSQTTRSYRYFSPYHKLSVIKMRNVLEWERSTKLEQQKIRVGHLYTSFALGKISPSLLTVTRSAPVNSGSRVLEALSYGLILARSFTRYNQVANSDPALRR